MSLPKGAQRRTAVPAATTDAASFSFARNMVRIRPSASSRTAVEIPVAATARAVARESQGRNRLADQPWRDGRRR